MLRQPKYQSPPTVFHYQTSKSISGSKSNDTSLAGGMLPQGFSPSSSDILCGRGKAYSNHPGNKEFSAVIKNSLQRYVDASKRIDKSMVVASVVTQILESGARFVKQEKSSGRWFQMSEDQVHEKTGHAIRDLIKSKGQCISPSSKKKTEVKGDGKTNSPSSHSAQAKKQQQLKKKEQCPSRARRSVCLEPINVLSEAFCPSAFESHVSRSFNMTTSELLRSALQASSEAGSSMDGDHQEGQHCQYHLLPGRTEEAPSPSPLPAGDDAVSPDGFLDSETIFASDSFFLEDPGAAGNDEDSSLTTPAYVPPHTTSTSSSMNFVSPPQTNDCYGEDDDDDTPDANDFVMVYELLSSDDESSTSSDDIFSVIARC
mmetsp:Transcript_16818/g.27289  ORF Transcript_16818/g.27289 Transcript_16818/m.27289 type:complete len:372 (-) Transcript_16818:318-1433(-)